MPSRDAGGVSGRDLSVMLAIGSELKCHRSRLALRDWAGSSAEATDHANIKPSTFIRHDEQSQSECPCSWVACSWPWLWS